jgi:2-polyprenyl-6-methoxyphenol hydroxylase-like FAD-dependent oxidoreductase
VHFQVKERRIAMNANTSDETSRVLVVGAGPVGLVVACELARRGVDVRLIDKLTAPTQESRAIIVHARSLEMMERIGMVDAIIDSGVKLSALEMHADGELLGRVELGTVDSPYPFSISTAQTETERVLAERLEALRVTIDRGVELVGLEQDDREVRSILRHADGSEELFVSSWIVGADGSHSTVRDQVGTKLEGSFKGETFLLGDVEGEYELDRRAAHTFFSSANGPLVAFPMLGGRLRLIGQIDSSDAAATPTLDQLQRLCDQQGAGIRLHSSHWLTVFEIHHAQVPQYRFGRAFLVGDSAHVHSPALGQGMNTGMQDAFNLGWKLALAVSGHAAAGLLDSYNEERHPVAAKVIKQTTAVTKAGALPHKFQRNLRNHALHLALGLVSVQRLVRDQGEMINIAYPDSPITGGAGPRDPAHPRPGEATTDVPGFEPALHSVLAADTGHTALYISGTAGPPAKLATNGAGVRHVLIGDAGTNGDSFDQVLPDPGRRVAEHYGLGARGGFVLVRPDGYIGVRAELGDNDSVTGYLMGIFEDDTVGQLATAK